MIYDIHTTTSMSCEGMPVRVPRVTTKDVRAVAWNCRATARASFRPNLSNMFRDELPSD